MKDYIIVGVFFELISVPSSFYFTHSCSFTGQCSCTCIVMQIRKLIVKKPKNEQQEPPKQQKQIKQKTIAVAFGLDPLNCVCTPRRGACACRSTTKKKEVGTQTSAGISIKKDQYHEVHRLKGPIS